MVAEISYSGIEVHWDSGNKNVYHPSELNPADPPAPSADDARLAEIREQLAKITPGEWEYESADGSYPPCVRVLTTRTDRVTHEIICEPKRWVPQFFGTPSELEINMKFIAGAPAAIRDLLARLDAVTRALASMSRDAYRDYVTQARGLPVTVMTYDEWTREIGIADLLGEAKESTDG